jgi:hypothetical protein
VKAGRRVDGHTIAIFKDNSGRLMVMERNSATAPKPALEFEKYFRTFPKIFKVDELRPKRMGVLNNVNVVKPAGKAVSVLAVTINVGVVHEQ